LKGEADHDDWLGCSFSSSLYTALLSKWITPVMESFLPGQLQWPNAVPHGLDGRGKTLHTAIYPSFCVRQGSHWTRLRNALWRCLSLSSRWHHDVDSVIIGGL
jgi:hypothetical protein